MTYTWNERPDTGECRAPSHVGHEVIHWPTPLVGDCEVMAVCRDKDTAILLTAALNAQQVTGQTEIDVQRVDTYRGAALIRTAP